jgi:acyl carrier protein
MDILNTIKSYLSEILDVDRETITEETYLVRDLEVESIDFLELAVALSGAFHIEVDDEDIFLLDLRLHLETAGETTDKTALLAEKYPFLGADRIAEILKDLDQGPVLKVKDLVSYVTYQCHVE